MLMLLLLVKLILADICVVVAYALAAAVDVVMFAAITFDAGVAVAAKI